MLIHEKWDPVDSMTYAQTPSEDNELTAIIQRIWFSLLQWKFTLFTTMNFAFLVAEMKSMVTVMMWDSGHGILSVLRKLKRCSNGLLSVRFLVLLTAIFNMNCCSQCMFLWRFPGIQEFTASFPITYTSNINVICLTWPKMGTTVGKYLQYKHYENKLMAIKCWLQPISYYFLMVDTLGWRKLATSCYIMSL